MNDKILQSVIILTALTLWSIPIVSWATSQNLNIHSAKDIPVQAQVNKTIASSTVDIVSGFTQTDRTNVEANYTPDEQIVLDEILTDTPVSYKQKDIYLLLLNRMVSEQTVSSDENKYFLGILNKGESHNTNNKVKYLARKKIQTQ